MDIESMNGRGYVDIHPMKDSGSPRHVSTEPR